MPTQWTLSLNPLPPSRTANTPACVGLHLLGALRLRRPRWALTPPASTRALARRGCPSLDGLQTAVLPPSVLTETVLGPPNRGFPRVQRVSLLRSGRSRSSRVWVSGPPAAWNTTEFGSTLRGVPRKDLRSSLTSVLLRCCPRDPFEPLPSHAPLRARPQVPSS